MKTFRLILTLLLCLAVPTAGWASVMSGPLCPRLHHEHGTSHEESQHSHAALAAAASADAGHHAQHVAGDAGHDTSCKGGHCGCGCGTGACSSSLLTLFALPASGILPLADKGHLPQDRDTVVLAVRGSSPLRPPIS